ncbi:MAG: methyl-accepting chemotaxis protein, partial [Paracoccaceae bacterium]|nr:methyl-accepting chemotaxis protein [Paracoccaceae bacterium]
MSYTSTNSSPENSGRLSNIRIGKRVAIMVFMGLAGLAALFLIYLFGDNDVAAETAHADEYTHMEVLAGEVDAQALQMRRREKDFILRNDMKYAESYHKAANAAVAALEEMEGLSVAGPQLGNIKNIKSKITEHAALLDQLVAASQRLGFDENQGLQGSLRNAVKDAETKLEEFGLDNLTVKMLMMRRYEKDFIMRGDDEYIKRIDASRAEFTSLLEEAMVPMSDKNEVARLLDVYVRDVKAYATGYHEERALRTQLSAKYSEAEPAMDTLFKDAEQGYATAQKKLASLRDNTRTVMLLAAAITGLIFAFFAWLLARSITTPVSALTETMMALAGGDKTVTVPSVGSRDEIGDMARAVLVFKDNMIRNEQMQAEQEAERAAKEQRGERVAALTDGFDAKARDVLQTVASAATELQQTAEGMAATAEQTNQQASAVATASNQATANVQTVATAAEELSA